MSKILVLAYMISPYRGSEYSVAWNYVKYMSQDHELVVLYGTSDEHLGDMQSMEEWLQHNHMQNVRFIGVTPNRLSNLLNLLNRCNILVYTFYLAYRLWHRQVYSTAKKLVKNEHFDLIHYVGPIGYREPGYLWKLPLPYVWGPIGGFNNVPAKMMKALPIAGKFKLGFRSVLNTIQMYTNRRISNAIKRTDILMTCSSVNQNAVYRIYGRDSICVPENCIIELYGLVNPEKFKEKKMKLVWIGRVDANKALNILIEALIKLPDKTSVELHVVGEGPLRESLMQYCQNSKLVNVIKWHGRISRQEVLQVLRTSHFHVVTSVSEGNPTTIWEAMSVGVPTITVDHCGMHDVICEHCGIKIPVTCYGEIVYKLSKAINELITNRERWKLLAEGTIECSLQYTWDKRRELLNSLYDKLLNK